MHLQSCTFWHFGASVSCQACDRKKKRKKGGGQHTGDWLHATGSLPPVVSLWVEGGRPHIEIMGGTCVMSQGLKVRCARVVCMSGSGTCTSRDRRWRTLALGCSGGDAASLHAINDDKGVLHACKSPVGIMKDVEKSLDDVRDDFEGMRAKTEGAVEATTLGIKPSQA